MESPYEQFPEEMGLEAVERCAYTHGRLPDSYLTTEPEYLQFWNRERTGFIGYFKDGKYLHIVGGLICPEELKEELLFQFGQWVDRDKLLPSFFSIPESDLELFERYGYQATKFGEDARLALKDHHWGGKSYSWVRRQVSFVSRQNIVYREVNLDELPEGERKVAFEKMQAMNEAQLSHRVLNHEIGLLEGRLLPDYFFRKRLFVAHPEGDPDNWQAFVACTPMQNGRGWATEMYRCMDSSVRGIIPFLFVKLIDQLQVEGVEEVSLCMVPGINTEEKRPGDCAKTRFFLNMWQKRLNFLFSVQGLYHYKSRFRPEFTPVYLCVRPRITNGSTFSFLKSVGLFRLNWGNLFKLCLPGGKKSD